MDKFNNGDELEFARLVRSEDRNAAGELDRFRPDLERILIGVADASPSEATDIAGDVFADCRLPDGPLAKFSGKGTLRGYLVTVARNKYADTKRGPRSRVDSIDGSDMSADTVLGSACDEDPAEDRITAILREAVLNAFAAADPEGLLVMRLVEGHQLTRRMLTSAWGGCHEATIGRMFDNCRDSVRKEILRSVREAEPLLDLEWEDFLRLCEDSTDLFGGSDDPEP